ncbi:hypothetical protein ACNKHK_10260 [Shigella flexneri]
MGFTSSRRLSKPFRIRYLCFVKAYPAVHMQTREMNTREQIAPLNEGTLDLGLLRNTQLPETLEREIICMNH